jgi:alkanesulfonate monooxygenase SsuD/methylene tetrahydromethanopterin reductase-like flavin-dependent oxidoreductase (luciferase family)
MPEQVQDRSTMLDELLVKVGRQPGDVRRTFNAPSVCGRTPQEMEARLHGVRRYGEWANLPQDDLLAEMRRWFAPFIGTPDEIVDQIRAYEAVGITEVTLQWFDTDDIEGLEVLAQEVVPHLTPVST